MSAALDDLTPDVDVIIVQPGRCSGGASHPAVLDLSPPLRPLLDSYH